MLIRDAVEPNRLAVDVLRSLIAGLIVALVGLGWLALVLVADLRSALGASPASWWLEQTFVTLHGLACIGLLFRRREAWWPAFVLTGLYLVQLIGAWIVALLSAHISLNVTLFLCALLLWRLFAAAFI